MVDPKHFLEKILEHAQRLIKHGHRAKHVPGDDGHPTETYDDIESGFVIDRVSIQDNRGNSQVVIVKLRGEEVFRAERAASSEWTCGASREDWRAAFLAVDPKPVKLEGPSDEPT